MVRCLTTKPSVSLTEREAEAELEHLLRKCKKGEDFLENCRQRFNGAAISFELGDIFRSATICRPGKQESIYARVFVPLL